MPKRLDRTYAFDMNSQPGIASKPITRAMVMESIRALGIEPAYVTALEMPANTNNVVITALLKDTDGAKVLGVHGPVVTSSGYLKHTYTVHITDDVEAMTPSEYYMRKADEDYATYKRVREEIIARYGNEEAYIKHTS